MAAAVGGLQRMASLIGLAARRVLYGGMMAAVRGTGRSQWRGRDRRTRRVQRHAGRVQWHLRHVTARRGRDRARSRLRELARTSPRSRAAHRVLARSRTSPRSRAAHRVLVISRAGLPASTSGHTRGRRGRAFGVGGSLGHFPGQKGLDLVGEGRRRVAVELLAQPQQRARELFERLVVERLELRGDARARRRLGRLPLKLRLLGRLDLLGLGASAPARHRPRPCAAHGRRALRRRRRVQR